MGEGKQQQGSLANYWLDIVFFVLVLLTVLKQYVAYRTGAGSSQFFGILVFALLYLLFLLLNPRSFLRVWFSRLAQRL
jgi:hypothetical protein